MEHADGRLTPLRVEEWRRLVPGDLSLLGRCRGPTLDVGSGPGRLTLALAERGIPALGIDVTPAAVLLARSCGALALRRDVYGPVPGTGRWRRVLLADGNIGIGGSPRALLHRVAELLCPGGRALVEVERPGSPLLAERVRLRHGDVRGPWFWWASLGADRITGPGRAAGLVTSEIWTDAGRWFVALRRAGLPRGRCGRP